MLQLRRWILQQGLCPEIAKMQWAEWVVVSACFARPVFVVLLLFFRLVEISYWLNGIV